MTAADDEMRVRAERARAVALFRYQLVREAADPVPAEYCIRPGRKHFRARLDLGLLAHVSSLLIAVGHCAMMSPHAAATGLPRHYQRVRAAAAAAAHRPREGRRDPRPPPPTRGTATASRRQRIRFDPADRAWLAALLHPLPRPALHRLRLLARPDTILRWHRALLARRHPAASR